MKSRVTKCLTAFTFAVTLVGCATTGKVAEVRSAPPSLETLLSQAATATVGGQPEKALSVLRSATDTYPTDKKPWLQIAQINFDRGNYGEAITNALEVLQRDSTDKVANSIVAVSGLRLSTKALADLAQQNNLSGTVRNEAQELAKLLRENLGETVLVPVRPKATSTSSKPIAPTGASAATGVQSPSTSASKAATNANAVINTSKPSGTEVPKTDTNPFSSLK
ncbi:MAG: hypothetical protein K2Y28_16075 [Burkholderiaceae bacterium]|nr:hypothetical protein [Burkholderiaceae bacterium]